MAGMTGRPGCRGLQPIDRALRTIVPSSCEKPGDVVAASGDGGRVGHQMKKFGRGSYLPLFSPRPEERDSDGRTRGLTPRTSNEKNFGRGSYLPPCGRRNGTPTTGRWGLTPWTSNEKNFRSWLLSPCGWASATDPARWRPARIAKSNRRSIVPIPSVGELSLRPRASASHNSS